MITEFIRTNPYVVSGVVALAGYVSLYFLKKILFSQVEKIHSRNFNRFDDVMVYTLAHTTQLFLVISALYAGFQFIPVRAKYPTWSWRIFFTVGMFQVAVWGIYFIQKWIQVSFSRKRKRDPASASSINVVEVMVKFTFLALVLLFTLHNMDIKVTAIIAGLGIGGVAIALALQNILGDLFASLSIILDKPFVIGDFIIMGESLGEVEYIGLKTTRIRSLGGEQIIVGNSDLLRSRIRNMKRMHERRNFFTISLPHETSIKQLRQAVEIITAVTNSKNQIRFDRCHFFRVTSTSLDIELVYFILSDDYNLHMDIQQSILMDIHQIFSQEGIHYACPMQRLSELENLISRSSQAQNDPKGRSLT